MARKSTKGFLVLGMGYFLSRFNENSEDRRTRAGEFSPLKIFPRRSAIYEMWKPHPSGIETWKRAVTPIDKCEDPKSPIRYDGSIVHGRSIFSGSITILKGRESVSALTKVSTPSYRLRRRNTRAVCPQPFSEGISMNEGPILHGAKG